MTECDNCGKDIEHIKVITTHVCPTCFIDMMKSTEIAGSRIMDVHTGFCQVEGCKNPIKYMTAFPTYTELCDYHYTHHHR